MKTSVLLLLVSSTALIAQGPLTPPPGANPALGPSNALTPGGQPQATMKSLQQVEPRTPLAAGQSGVTVSSFGGFTITAPGSYYLTANLTVSAGTGIEIGGVKNVTVDLNGFQISSNSPSHTGYGISLHSAASEIRIHNGHIHSTNTITGNGPAAVRSGSSGFTDGVRIGGDVAHVYLENLTISGIAEHGIYTLTGGSNNTNPEGIHVNSVNVSNAGGNGIKATTITNCSVRRTLDYGIVGHTISHSTVIVEKTTAIRASIIRGSSERSVGSVTGCYGETRGAATGEHGILGGQITNSHGYSVGGYGLWGDSVANSTGISTGRIGITAGTVSNSVGEGATRGIFAQVVNNSRGTATETNGAGILVSECASNSSGIAAASGGTGIDGSTTALLTGCWGSGGSTALRCKTANGCVAAAGATSITNRYNMPASP